MNQSRSTRKTIFLFFVFFALILSIAAKAQALEPKLLWEKKLPFKIYDLKMAAESGDVILSSKDARQIILYDKNGNKRFHWGPRVDRAPFGIDISADGSKIIYNTSWTAEYMEAKKLSFAGPFDSRIHYSTRKGKELWNKKIEGGSYLSPDGTIIAVGPIGGEGKNLTLLDSTGKILWKYIYEIGGASDVIFSPDSIDIGLCDEGVLRLLDRYGNLLFEKAQCQGIISISEGGSYISTNPYYELERSHKGRVYDKTGNIFFEGVGFVSANGQRLVLSLDAKTVIYSLPDKTILKEYPIQGSETAVSADGRFIVVMGKRTDTASANNIFIIDMQENGIWETYVIGSPKIFLTKDGKYLLIRIYQENKLVYYQLY